MANEITANISLAITSLGQSVSGSKQFQATLSADSFLGEEVTVGSTTAATLNIGGLTDPAAVLIINLDDTNFIQVDKVSAMTSWPMKLLPGQGVLLTPESGTIYALADTAPCQVYVVAG